MIQKEYLINAKNNIVYDTEKEIQVVFSLQLFI